MGWGQNPVDTAAAQKAADEAQARLANRTKTPFERQLLEVLAEIRDELARQRPVPLEPIVGTVEGGLISVREGTAVDLGGLWGLAGVEPRDYLHAVDAAAAALYAGFPVLRDDFTWAGMSAFARTVIDAAVASLGAERPSVDLGEPAVDTEVVEVDAEVVEVDAEGVEVDPPATAPQE